MASWLIGASGLAVLLLVALLVSHRRPFPPFPPSRRRRLIGVGILAILVQAVHFVEELTGRFYESFPTTLGLEPWELRGFVAFNLVWLALWISSLLGAPRGHRWAEWPLWFLALALVANGVAHPALALARGAYFPGLWTSPLTLVGGLALMNELVRLTRV